MVVKDINPNSKGEVVVFLHGFLLDSSLWDSLNLKELLWRSILIDLPYHGRSAQVSLPERNIAAYATYVQNCLEDLGLERFNIVGHSMGGYVALEMLKKESPINKLILLHSNIWADSPEQKKNRDRVKEVIDRNKKMFLQDALPLLFHEPENRQPTIYNLIEKGIALSNQGVEHSALTMRDRANSFKIIQKKKENTYFIQGKFDKLIPNFEAKRVWQEHAISGHFFEIEHVGHMSPIEDPKNLTSLLCKILV